MTYWEKRHIGEKKSESFRKGRQTRIKRNESVEIQIRLLQFELETRKLSKSVRGMPRLSEAKKDVTSCDKLRGGANIR